jgi:hypothetical protein
MVTTMVSTATMPGTKNQRPSRLGLNHERTTNGPGAGLARSFTHSL